MAKDDHKKDLLTRLMEANPWMKNPCQKCRNVKLIRCKCGPGAGEEVKDDGEDSSFKNDNFKTTETPARKTDPSFNIKSLKFIRSIEKSDTTLLSKDKIFKADVIADLLFNRLFTIRDNHEDGVLTIKSDDILRHHRLSDDEKLEITKFMNAILHELDSFKIKNGLIDKNCVCKPQFELDSLGKIKYISGLTINIFPKNRYDEFIDQLTDTLVPRFNPLSIKPSPTTARKKSEEDAYHNNKKSSIRKPFSIDGPKPIS